MKNLGLAPDTVGTKAMNLVGVVDEDPDTEVSERWDTRRFTGRGVDAVTTLV